MWFIEFKVFFFTEFKLIRLNCLVGHFFGPSVPSLIPVIFSSLSNILWLCNFITIRSDRFSVSAVDTVSLPDCCVILFYFVNKWLLCNFMFWICNFIIVAVFLCQLSLSFFLLCFTFLEYLLSASKYLLLLECLWFLRLLCELFRLIYQLNT